MTGKWQRLVSSVCLFAFYLPAAIAEDIDAPQEVATDTQDDTSSAVSDTGKTGNAGTTVEADGELTGAEQRELDSDENPMDADEARRAERRSDAPEARTTGLDIYGSARIRYRDLEVKSEWQDGDSRLGANIDWRVLEKSYLYGRYELGFNVLTGLESVVNPGDHAGENVGDTAFTRLAYIGIDTPHVNYIAGKNWSTYYEVSYFTDRYMGIGGSASGTYNAQTDGGPTGPGRADRTLQTHFSIDFLPAHLFKPFELKAQLQHGNPIPFGNGADYDTALGLSAILTTRDNLTLGVAYNHAQIDMEKNPSLRKIGLSGDARATLLGTRAFGDRWYAGFVAARLENHETTDDGIYFKGWGSELYLQYRIAGPFWFVGGYNALEPDANESLARDYRLKYAVAGLRYTFKDFRRMIFANVRIDDSLNADGTPGSNVYTIGIRWDMSKRGWHRSD